MNTSEYIRQREKAVAGDRKALRWLTEYHRRRVTFTRERRG